MAKNTTQQQGVTLENWQFALAPLTDDEQKRINIAIAGLQKFAEHVQPDSRIGEMDFVAGCFADLVTENLSKKSDVRKFFNHVFARALNDNIAT